MLNLMSDKNHLRTFFYDSATKLKIRITTWKKYGTNQKAFFLWVREMLSLSDKKHRHLDVGCGTGQLLMELHQIYLKLELYGIDISPAMIVETKKNIPDIKILEGDVEKLPFENEYFDSVTAIHVLHHVSNQIQAIKEMIRVIRKSGIIFITTTDYDVGSGLNKLHYEGLKKLGFPQFMRDTSSYLRFTPDHAKQIFNTLSISWTTHVYQNDVVFTDVEPVMAYYQSAMMYRQSYGIDDKRIPREKWNDLYEYVAKGVANTIKIMGSFRMPGRVIGFKLKP
jgi:ubiquinone/menaquinone biosynthesis C-methylase UbiE